MKHSLLSKFHFKILANRLKFLCHGYFWDGQSTVIHVLKCAVYLYLIYCCHVCGLIHFSCCQVHKANVCCHQPVLSQTSPLKMFKLLTCNVAALVIIGFPPVPQGHRLFFPLHVETGLVEGPGYQALSKHGQGQCVFSTVLFVQLWVITQALKSQHSFGSLAALWSLSPRRHLHGEPFDFWGIDVFFQVFNLYRCMCSVYLIRVARKGLQGSLALILMTSIWNVFLSWEQRKYFTHFDIIFFNQWVEICISCIDILKRPVLQAYPILFITLT